MTDALKQAKSALHAPPLHELTAAQARFCELVINGMRDIPAYMEAFNTTRANAEMNAWRMKGYEGVRNTIQAGRSAQWSDAVLTLAEKRAYLKLVVETEIEDVDANSILCQEWTYEQTGGARGKLKRGGADQGNEIEEEPKDRIKVKMPCKLKAIELDAKLAGELAQDKAAVVVADAFTELLDHVRKPGSPFGQPRL